MTSATLEIRFAVCPPGEGNVYSFVHCPRLASLRQERHVHAYSFRCAKRGAPIGARFILGQNGYKHFAPS